MSHVGSLSYEHERAQDLAQKIDEMLEGPHGRRGDRQARMELRPLLLAMVDLLDPLRAEATASSDVMMVPVGVVRRLKTKRFEGQKMSDALGDLASNINRRGRRLSDKELRLLEEVKGETVREVSDVYSRMVRH